MVLDTFNTKPKVLILEDDLVTLRRHQSALEKEGFQCFSTQLASQAIALMLKDTSIKFALIDVILHAIGGEDRSSYDLDLFNGYLIDEPEMQAKTGDGVVREINSQRRDVSYIFITFAPEIKSQQSDNQLLTLKEEEARLRRNRGVVDVIHRYQLDDSSIQNYRRVANHIEKAYARPFIPVREEIIVAHYSRSIGRIQIIPHFHNQSPFTNLKRYGTGWLIANDLVLTCWHLFSQFNDQKEKLESGALDIQATIAASKIAFDYLSLGTGETYNFSELISWNSELDYALLRLCHKTDHPISQRPPLQLEICNPTKGEPGMIIIHHPKGLAKQSSHGWYVKLSDDTVRVFYKILTNEGTSGAPVIRADNAKAIAVHTGFNCMYNLQEGVLIDKIMKDIHDYKPHIYEEIVNCQ